MTLRQIYFLQCAFFNWVDFADPKAPISVLISMKSILLTSRYQFYFCSALSSMGPILMTLRHQFSVLVLVKPILLTSRYQFISCSALSSVESILLTLRHDFDPFGCPHLGGADLIDFEVLVYFLQWIAL